jgi:glutathione S-transferase
MKLYRCRTPTDRLCPCGKVARRLHAGGLAFEAERVPLSRRPQRRADVVALTGQPLVPVLVLDDGTALHPCRDILDHLDRTGATP